MSAMDYSWDPPLVAQLRRDKDALRAAATLPGYHIASDGIGEEWLWKDHPTRPEQILPKRALRGHPDVWALLVRATGGGL